MFNYKKTAVLGLGNSGLSAVKLLSKLNTELFISDKDRNKYAVIQSLENELDTPIDHELGSHSDKVLDCDLIIVSPGISKHEDILVKARDKGKEIWSELELGFSRISPKKVIAVTGTNGKTTTAVLAGEICKAYGHDTICCGNIGLPITSIVDKVTKETILVVEVSSYQLEFIKKFHADSACVLNITPDHLERHVSLEHYAEVKAQIFKNQSADDLGIYNADDLYQDIVKKNINSRQICFAKRGNRGDIYYFDDKIWFNTINWIYDCKNIIIPGEHNIQNIMAAAGLCFDIIKNDTKILDRVISSFKGVEHRLEKVIEKNGILFVNDSKSTNVDSTESALKSFSKNIILLMGGKDKLAPYKPLIPAIRQRVKHIIAYGEAGKRIKDELISIVDITEKDDLKQAVHKAVSIGERGDIILLSPACSSFDQFLNFEERGKKFKEIVLNLN
ncbi:UDP-N-acetylmuramoyl-L-alanine--D-glutamate ligase [bacterium]